MTIEEIRAAKQEAEDRIRSILEALQERTGMRLRTVEIDLLHTSTSDYRERKRETVVHVVAIDLQL